MTKKIICSGGEEILVDDEDYPVLCRHKWHYTCNGSGQRRYAVTRLNTSDDKIVRTIFMHNMILGFAFYVDHHDNDTKNNKKKNLRPATWQQNGWNRGKPKTGRHGKPTSKYKGVSYSPYKGRDRWLALIKHVEEGAHKSTGKLIRIGYFWDEKEAAKAYNKKVKELRGEWAWVNPL